MSILIILLGCHIGFILQDRVNVAVKFANLYNSNLKYYELEDYKINWYLSGGKKYDKDKESEADTMKTIIMSKNESKYNWNFIIDDISTNTAQNFILANKIQNYEKFTDIYVVTSEFHYDRAKKIAELTNENAEKYKWILSSKENSDSRYWEKIHMKNIENDVISAKRHLYV